VFVFGGYFGGCLRVARGRPSVRERGRDRGRIDGATKSAQGRARGQVLRQTGLSSEGLGRIGRVQGGPWRGRRRLDKSLDSRGRTGAVVSGGGRVVCV
jgi:hypothetical protein